MKAHGSSCATVDVLYWRNIAGNTIAETDSAGATNNSSYHEYVFFAGRRIARADWGSSSYTVYYYFVDHLGSTRLMTNASGSACFKADYLPYGAENTPSGFTDSCNTTYKFTGYERDGETGLDYAFARYYNQRLARFMSGDPLAGDTGDPQSLNRYAYVRNNPINAVDPTGAVCLTLPMGIGGPVGIICDGSSSSGGGDGGDIDPNSGICVYIDCSNPSRWPTDPNCVLYYTCQPPCSFEYCTGAPGGTGDPSGGGGGGGGAQTPVETKPQSTAATALAILDCAEKQADHYSIAGLLGAKKGSFLGNVAHAFGGNSVSGVLDVAWHLESGLQAASVGDRHGVAVATFNVNFDLALGGTAQGVLASGGNPAAGGLVGWLTDAALGTAAKTVGTWKIGIDTGIFIASAAYCAAHQGN